MSAGTIRHTRRRPVVYCRSSGRGSIHRSLPRGEVLLGDARQLLDTLPAASVDTVVTSPPYHLLRRYGSGPGEIGTEPNVVGYVNEIVAVCDELERVVKPTGSLWLNLGDSYSRAHRYGAPPKSLLLAPERVLLGLADRGWTVRSKVVWAKPNPMPSSVRDRLSCSWEPLYLLTRSRHYYFDLDSIREPHRSSRAPIRRAPVGVKYGGGKRPAWAGPLAGANDGLLKARAEGRAGHPLGKNPTDVWRVATAGYRGSHFATFPPALIERPIKATCPELVCAKCGIAWNRNDGEHLARCQCDAPARAGTVLDPFMGSGTTAVVAERLGRDWLGIELNPEYRELALQRIGADRARREEVMKKNRRRNKL
jgi:site-specific DNA-methyltransferase (adenine-specific)